MPEAPGAPRLTKAPKGPGGPGGKGYDILGFRVLTNILGFRVSTTNILGFRSPQPMWGMGQGEQWEQDRE